MKLVANYYQIFAFLIILNFISFSSILTEESTNKSYLQNKLYSKFNSKNKSKKLQIEKFYSKSELNGIKDSYSENFPEEKISFKKKIEVNKKTNHNENNNTNKQENLILSSLKNSLNGKKNEGKLNSNTDLSLKFNEKFSMKDFDLEQLEGNYLPNAAEAKQNLKDFANKDYHQLNVYNNFLITNSTITQMLDTFLSSKKTLPQSNLQNLFFQKANLII